MRFKRLFLLVVLCILFFENVACGYISDADRAIILEVSKEYSLNVEESILLLAIRQAENGGDGVEFGIINKEARRYAGDHEKSLRLQAQWCAGTIKKRHNCDLIRFSRRYCPIGCDNDNGTNQYWLKNVRYFIKKEKERGVAT